VIIAIQQSIINVFLKKQIVFLLKKNLLGFRKNVTLKTQ